jgi:hypothetical protein
MAIRKQEFYEGAALHLLARNGSIRSIRYNPPLFLVNDEVFLLLKYSTKGRSPWGFTFTTDEQRLLVRTCTHTVPYQGAGTTCTAQTLRLDRTKRRTCWPAELAGFLCRARTQLRTVLGLRIAHRTCSLGPGALPPRFGMQAAPACPNLTI